MSDQIKTKWHKFEEAVLGTNPKKVAMALDSVGVKEGLEMDLVDRNMLRACADVVRDVPKFVIDRSLMDLLKREDVTRTLEALHRAKMHRLPYPNMLLEFDEMETVKSGGTSRDEWVRSMVLLSERADGEVKNEAVSLDDYPYRTSNYRVIPDRARNRELLMLPVHFTFMGMGDDAGPEKVFGTHYKVAPAVHMNMQHPRAEAAVKSFSEARVHAESRAVFAAVLLLRTRGLYREVIEPTGLNRQRRKDGRPEVPRHHVMRIGRVYDRSGQEHDYEKTGRKMPVHWRKGYVRSQRFGPGLSREYDLFIEPCLVNYEDGPLPEAPVTGVTW